MADSKITALAALTAADPVNDMFPVVDVSDTSMAASGTTKRISVNNILSSSPTASGALTVTGLVTAGSATITGNLTVDTNTLFVNSSNDRVGIGTVSPNNTLTVRGSQDAGIEINSADSNMSRLIFAYDPANTRWYINSTLSGSGTTLPLAFLIQNSEVARFNTTGNLAFASGKGIDFTAAGNVAGMTSELLNDYEEGTFTVGIAFGGASVGVVYAQQIGIYTKVGRIVHFSGRVDLTNKGTSTGSATITGLPFSANLGAASVGYQSSAAPSGAQVMLTLAGTDITIRYATGTTTAESTDANFANNSIIIFGGTYAI